MSEVQGKRTITKQRVCDLCLPRPSTDETVTPRSRRGSAWSENTQSSGPSDSLITPDYERMGQSSLILSRVGSRSSNPEYTAQDTDDELAPIESWMGPSGVLSLYPLAVKPSHVAATAPPPAAGPLFAPSLAAKRSAKEKEIERTLRQRRTGSDNLWVPATWGYKREDFDSSCHDEDVNGPAEVEGGLVVDGPIRFRASAKKITSPALSRVSTRTPSEERNRFDLSTF